MNDTSRNKIYIKLIESEKALIEQLLKNKSIDERTDLIEEWYASVSIIFHTLRVIIEEDDELVIHDLLTSLDSQTNEILKKLQTEIPFSGPIGSA